jgi:hypothetical protein
MHGIPYSVHPLLLRGREDEVSNNLGIGGSLKGIALVSKFGMK